MIFFNFFVFIRRSLISSSLNPDEIIIHISGSFIFKKAKSSSIGFSKYISVEPFYEEYVISLSVSIIVIKG